MTKLISRNSNVLPIWFAQNITIPLIVFCLIQTRWRDPQSVIEFEIYLRFNVPLLVRIHCKRRPCPSDIHQIKNKPDPVMSNDTSIIDLALANLLDVIPLITNTDENVDPALLRIYDRNAAIINDAYL